MTEKLEELNDTYNREDQELKREIGKFVHDRPGRWISKQQIVDWADIDESVVNRHLTDFHEAGFLKTKYRDNGQLQVQWNGRGVGGFGYWVRRAVPAQLWAAGKEIRPLLTIDALGGAYVPTLFFFILWLIGLLTAIFAIIISYAPGNSIFGITVVDAVVMTGIVTVGASLFLILIPVAILFDNVLHLAWQRMADWMTDTETEE